MRLARLARVQGAGLRASALALSAPRRVSSSACACFSAASASSAASARLAARPPPVQISDYPAAHLRNRNASAPLLRYCDNVRRHGHRAANIDPLGLMHREDAVAALDPLRYGLHPTSTYDVRGVLSFPDGREAGSSMADIVEHLRRVYIGDIGWEFFHQHSKAQRNWWCDYLEREGVKEASKEESRRSHALVTGSEELDRFLAKKFPSVKRYGAEGAESMLVIVDQLLRSSLASSIPSIILSSPHRGRLSLLASPIFGFPHSELFRAMAGQAPAGEEGMTFDVLSHLAQVTRHGATSIEMLPNPSHLEAIAPLAAGYARAQGAEALNIALHGDAAFAGQGVVSETFGLSELPDYANGGTIHLIVNNNIGYTTASSAGRSSLYASDIAKMIGAPIIHVNGDAPDACARAARAAFEYRARWRRDVVVDLIVYRRWGHNELDEPAFTQPKMYRDIRKRRSVPEAYEAALGRKGVLGAGEALSVRQAHRSALSTALEAMQADPSPTREQTPQPWESSQWQEEKIAWPHSAAAVHDPETGVALEKLRELGERSVNLPDGFALHSTLERHVKQRRTSLQSGEGVNWATAEALAWASLLAEGYDVRISGQDVGRGTFSQRHAMLVDQQTEATTVPLNEPPLQGTLELANSPLSELSVLAFEAGQSWARPRLLPLWEAQFGDFFNGAQVTIDTLVSSAEAKWGRQSALVMLLPHGMDGAGPEHSSARIERFLQLSDDPFDAAPSFVSSSMPVVYPTTPAQYFHLLRRQMLRNYRKPLVVAAPKGLLRAPYAASALEEMAPGTSFRSVLVDASSSASPVERIILCAGKHYYALRDERQKRELAARVALVRLEELSPFPFQALQRALSPLVSPQTSLVWAQEEPQNQGAYSFVEPRIRSTLAKLGGSGTAEVRYAGPPPLAVPAWGIKRSTAELFSQAFAHM